MPTVKAFFLIILFSGIGFTHTPCYGAFELENLSPTATALRGAYSALGTDSWAILYNPAQITQLEETQAAFSYSKPSFKFSQLETNSFSGIFTRNAFNIGYGLGLNYLDTNIYYREATGIFNFGERWGEKEDLWNFSIGSNVNFFYLRRGDPSKTNDPALVPKTILKMNTDLGIHIRVRWIHLGISYKNLLPANMGSVSKENLPQEIRIGVGANKILDYSSLSFSPILEMVQRSEGTKISFGGKITFLNYLEFYGGFSANSMGLGFTLKINRDKEDKKNLSLSVSTQYSMEGVENFAAPLVGVTFQL